jgi:hypothetical protein
MKNLASARQKRVSKFFSRFMAQPRRVAFFLGVAGGILVAVQSLAFGDEALTSATPGTTEAVPADTSEAANSQVSEASGMG